VNANTQNAFTKIKLCVAGKMFVGLDLFQC